MPRLRRMCLVFAVCLWLPALAEGQTPLPNPHVQVMTDAGQPAVDVEIFLFADGPKPLSKTNALGACDLPTTTLTRLKAPSTPGSRYAVWQRRCKDGKIAIILVPEGVTVTKEQLGCAGKNAGGQDCDCEDRGFVVLGPNVQIRLSASAAATMNPNMNMNAMHPGGAPISIGTIHVNGAFKFSSFSHDKARCAGLEAQLVGLGYNQNTGCTPDTSGAGPVFGGGATWTFPGLPVPIYTGAQFEFLGGGSVNIHQASRIGVAGSASNVVFSDSESYKVNLFNVEVGPMLDVGPIQVMPFVTFSRASVTTTMTSELRAGPPGTVIPTTVVKSDNNTSSASKFGVGFGARATYHLPNGLGVFAQWQYRNIADAFPTGIEPTGVGTNGVAFGACYGFNIRH